MASCTVLLIQLNMVRFVGGVFFIHTYKIVVTLSFPSIPSFTPTQPPILARARQSLSDCLFIACRDFIWRPANYTQTCKSDGNFNYVPTTVLSHTNTFNSLGFILFLAFSHWPTELQLLLLIFSEHLIFWPGFIPDNHSQSDLLAFSIGSCTAIVHCPNDKCFRELNVCNFHY